MITFTDEPDAFATSVHDVYYHPAYGRSAELIDGGTWEGAFDGDTGVSYSYIRREIAARAGSYDTITPYGYGGMSAPADATPAALEQFRAEYLSLARERGLVAEFARLNPLDASEVFERDARRVSEHATFGSRIVDVDEEFAAVSGNHRTAVRKSIKLGVTVDEVDVAGTVDAAHPFRRLYEAAMHALDARDELHLGDEYFERLLRLPGGTTRLLVARHEGGVVAAAMFFVWRARVHYHLSAASPHGRSVHATNAIIEHAKRHLLEPPFDLHLGGGLRQDDSLSRFKRRCASSEHSMRLTERVVDEEAFVALTRGLPPTGYFPPYRDPALRTPT